VRSCCASGSSVRGAGRLARRINLNWEVNDLLKDRRQQAGELILAQLEAARALLVRASSSPSPACPLRGARPEEPRRQLSLLLSNAVRHKHDPHSQEDMLGTIAHRWTR